MIEILKSGSEQIYTLTSMILCLSGCFLFATFQNSLKWYANYIILGSSITALFSFFLGWLCMFVEFDIQFDYENLPWLFSFHYLLRLILIFLIQGIPKTIFHANYSKYIKIIIMHLFCLECSLDINLYYGADYGIFVITNSLDEGIPLHDILFFFTLGLSIIIWTIISIGSTILSRKFSLINMTKLALIPSLFLFVFSTSQFIIYLKQYLLIT
jgi:hypothetical protein